MARNRKVNSNRHDISKMVMELLEEYSDQITEEVAKKVPEVARDTVDKIETMAPKDSGEYSASWNVEYQHPTRLETTAIIYSDKPGLPHLLEFGHALKRGGRTLGHVNPSPAGGHIAPAEEQAVKQLEEKILEAIRNAG